MKEYIDREALIAEYDRVHQGPAGGARKLMVDAPAADVVEVRHGEWVLEHGEYGKMMCSVCKKSSPTERKPDPYEDFHLADFLHRIPILPQLRSEDGRRKEGAGMNKIINYIRDKIAERKWLKEKPCAACKYFDYYMGSAGVCTAKGGCPATRMKDYADFCDCGCFKKRR